MLQDVRGRYRSEGKFVPFVREYEDGYDTVRWAASLPGCDGSVGMHGLSYLGKTQWHAAVTRPPWLKSMAPVQTWGNHLNGVQELGLMQFWAQSSLTLDLLFRKYSRDPEKIGAAIGSSLTRVAHQTIFQDGRRPSRLTLTVVEG